MSISPSPMVGAGSGALLSGKAEKGSFLTFYGEPEFSLILLSP